MPNKKKKQTRSPKKEDQVLYRLEAPSSTKSKLYYRDKRYYFNVHVRRWKKVLDGDWKNGPLIYKVPLYPEQAVLSCCSTIPKAARFGGGWCLYANEITIDDTCHSGGAIKGTQCGVGADGSWEDVSTNLS